MSGKEESWLDSGFTGELEVCERKKSKKMTRFWPTLVLEYRCYVQSWERLRGG